MALFRPFVFCMAVFGLCWVVAVGDGAGYFQCWRVLLIQITVEQEPTMLAVGAGRGVWIFSLPCHLSFLS